MIFCNKSQCVGSLIYSAIPVPAEYRVLSLKTNDLLPFSTVPLTVSVSKPQISFRSMTFTTNKTSRFHTHLPSFMSLAYTEKFLSIQSEISYQSLNNNCSSSLYATDTT
jgi:hypothetical protein